MGRMTLRWSAAGIVAAVLLTACSSSSEIRGSSSAPSRNLKSQLLTVSELPSGWAIDNSSDSGSASTPPCLTNLKSTLTTTDKAEISFVKGTSFPDFDQQLGYFGTATSALAQYRAGSGILNNCKDVSFTSDGHQYTGSIGQLSFPTLGQRSTAWQLTISAEGFTFGVDAVLVQKGPELSFLLFFDLGSVEISEFLPLARKAVAKMPAS